MLNYFPMTNAILTLNYIHVLIVTVAGFLFGWLWHSPLLFAKPWMAEMKITEEKMKAAAQKGMAKLFLLGFFFTFLGTFGLAVILNAHQPETWIKGAMVGGFIGVAIVGMRYLNTGVWEQRSIKLMAINVGHEALLVAGQGALLVFLRDF